MRKWDFGVIMGLQNNESPKNFKSTFFPLKAVTEALKMNSR